MRFFTSLLIIFVIHVAANSTLLAQDKPTASETPLRVGIIGLDTSHVPAFTKMFNQTPPLAEMRGCRVVAAYPFGSRDIESSSSRIPKYTAAVKDLGVEVVDSIEALLAKVDCVLLETNDGRPTWSRHCKSLLLANLSLLINQRDPN